MVNSVGFLGRTMHRNAAVAPRLIDLLPESETKLRLRVEPRLAELVGTVVASLRAAGLPSVPVTDPHGRRWAAAYILGRLETSWPLKVVSSITAVAEVVVDGSGRLVRNHPVQVLGSADSLLPVSCPNMADRYEQFIRAVKVADEPRGDAMVLTRHGDLLISAPGRKPEPIALVDYLTDLCRAATRPGGRE